MINFSTWSIKNPIPVILMFMILTLAGLYSFNALHVQRFPDISLPSIAVSLHLPGASPTQLEAQVARKTEDAIAQLSGVKHINTAITTSHVNIIVEFELEKSLSDALINTKDAIDRIRADLPKGLDAPSVSAINITQGEALATYAIASTQLNDMSLSWFIDDTLSKKLLAIPGVGKVERIGGVTREIQITVDSVKLAALNVTIDEISQALKAVQLETTGGQADIGEQKQTIRVMANVEKASDLRDLPLALSGGGFIKLSEIATVHDTTAEPRSIARLNGKPIIGFKLFRAKGFDEINVAKLADDTLKKLVQQKPALGLNITPVYTTNTDTLSSYQSSMNMLYEGALLAVVVVGLFLRHGRATLIAAAALPLSIIPTFFAMYWFNFSLNTITLLALAVVVGILVDDAIVEVENMMRHLSQGKTVKKAAIDAVNEIALAVIATTFTLIAVFLPTAIMHGISGMFFKQFGWTIVISVLFSLLVARLLTPMMCVYFIKQLPSHQQKPPSKTMKNYLTLLQWCLHYRKITLAFGLLLFVLSCALLPLLKTGFIPAEDIGYININMELPPGSTYPQTLNTANLVEKALKNTPGIAHVFAAIGAADPNDPMMALGEIRKGVITVSLTDKKTRNSQHRIERQIREQLKQVPGARFSISSGSPGEVLMLVLSSENQYALLNSARKLEKQIRQTHLFSNVKSTASLLHPEMIIRPDWQRAAELGITTEQIAQTVRIATKGDYAAELAKLNLDNRQVNIVLRIANDLRKDMHTLENLNIMGREGLVPLSSVATISLENGPSQIDRFDRSRYIMIKADLVGIALGDALKTAKSLPALQQLPADVKLINMGDTEIMDEIFNGFAWAMFTGIIAVFCVLVLLFKDFFQPLTILCALPLSAGGAFLALLLSNEALNLPSLIGLVMLMGIVTKNSILLVECGLSLQRAGKNLMEATLTACQYRARPIIMTTLAMIAGMLPIALGIGSSNNFKHPMAITVIGGLITSTALSLLIVPVVFTYVASYSDTLKKTFKG